jgi:hypothetical protein
MKKFLKYKLVGCLSALSFAFAIGGPVWAYVALHGVPTPLILHFNNLRGINQVGSVGDLSQIGIVGLLIVSINTAIALELETRNRFWGKFVAALTLFLAALLFIGFAAIINVNQ